jgi:hypothetical protein
MRQVLVALLGMATAGVAQADTYTFTAVVYNNWRYQTLVHCANPITETIAGRIPKGCILKEPTSAWPNNRALRGLHPGIKCAAGDLIEFYPNGTLKYCALDGTQYIEVEPPQEFAWCSVFAHFDEKGIADCD